MLTGGDAHSAQDLTQTTLIDVYRHRRRVTGADGVAARDETRRMLAQLAPRARTILVLRYYADLDDSAIADVLRISPSTVRATASRALAGLREKEALRTMENKHG